MRTLKEIALEIVSDWKEINNVGAQNALNCLKIMETVNEPFMADSNGYNVIGSFLAHSAGWKGEVARRVKRELRIILGHPRP